MASLMSRFRKKVSKKQREDRRKSNSEKPDNNVDNHKEPRPGCSTSRAASSSVKELGKDDANMGPSNSGNHANKTAPSRYEEELNKGEKGKRKKGMSMNNESTLEKPDHQEDSKNESIVNASLRSSLSSEENTKRESISEESSQNIACENESLHESLVSDQDNNVPSGASNNLRDPDNELVAQLQHIEIINATVRDKTDEQQLQSEKTSISEHTKANSMNLAKLQNPDVPDIIREAEEHSLHVHAQEQAQSKVEPLVSDILSKEMEDRISLKLDRGSSVLANWENLACELNAPPNIRAQCRRTTMESPTELLFESLNSWRHTENLTVNEVIAFLNEMKRKDAVEVIEKAIPAHQRDCQVSDKITNNLNVLEELATKLDKESRVLKNWKYLGLKLGVKREILQEIGNGNSPNAVEALFEYIYSTMPGLTVEQFKEKMEKIKRVDVLDLFTDTETGKMMEVVPLHSDLMCSICYMLNKSSAALKNWRHLASELGIDYNTYKSFEPDRPQSPTSILLEWACYARGDNFTIRELCGKLEKMKRYDVIEVIEKEFGQNFRKPRHL